MCLDVSRYFTQSCGPALDSKGFCFHVRGGFFHWATDDIIYRLGAGGSFDYVWNNMEETFILG